MRLSPKILFFVAAGCEKLLFRKGKYKAAYRQYRRMVRIATKYNLT